MLSKEAGTLTPMTDTSIFICRFLKLPDSVRPGILTDLYLKILTEDMVCVCDEVKYFTEH